jgi:small subunit ribosomal protein S1
MSSDTPAPEDDRPGVSRPPRERPQRRFDKPPSLDTEQATKGPRIRELDDQIEAELQAAMGGLSENELYGDPKQRRAKPVPGAERKQTGKVIAIHGGDVFVDMPGQRSQGVLSLQQFDGQTPAIGSEVEFEVEGYVPGEGLIQLTRKGAAKKDVDWSSVANGMIVEARVTGTNKGGLAVEVNGIRGFLPVSQIDLYRVEHPEQFVNQRLRCVITEVSPEDRNLVVSRRALLERERELQRDQLWADLEEGQTRTGTVRSVRPFGVFVDIGGADGLVPMSELSWARVADASQLVSPGQQVQVYVAKVDREARKIGLSLRRLTASPWDTITDRLHPGDRVKGKITRLMEFGAFMEVEPGIEGLIHVSELAPQRVRRPRDVVQEGQEVEAQVLTIDSAQRRIGLSLKAALMKPTVEEPEEPEEPDPTPKPERKRNYTLRGGTGAAGPG